MSESPEATVPFVGGVVTLWVVGILTTILVLIIDISLAVTSAASTQAGSAALEYTPFMSSYTLSVAVYAITAVALGATYYATTVADDGTTLERPLGAALVCGTGLVALLALVVIDQQGLARVQELDLTAERVQVLVQMYETTVREAAPSYGSSAGVLGGYLYDGRIVHAAVGGVLLGAASVAVFIFLSSGSF